MKTPYQHIQVCVAALILAVTFALTQLAGAQTSYSWVTNSAGSGNWNNPTNWSPNSPSGGPLGIDSVSFGDTAASGNPSPTTINNTLTDDGVHSSFGGTVTNLTYNSSSLPTAFTYNVTEIPAGKTLTVKRVMLVGGVNEVSTGKATQAYLVGGGTLLVTGTNLMIQNYDNTSRSGATAYLNLSGLTNFVYNNANGGISIEDNPNGNTGLGGNLILACRSNNITANTINLGTSTSAQAGPAGVIILGPGTNIINASTINIAAQKSTFTIETNAAGTGGLRIRGVTGADNDSSCNITIGNRNVGGGTGVIQGNMLLNGIPVDIKVGALIVGQNTSTPPSSANDGGTGVLQFDTGTVTANSLLMAYNTKANNASSTSLALCNGTIDVGSHGTLLIGAGQLFALATAANTGSSTGTLVVSNGLVNCQGPIVMGTNVGILNGSIILQQAGTLNMGPGSYIGTIAAPVTSLTLDTNSSFSISIPSVTFTNVCVSNLFWPNPDTGLTLQIAAFPTGITNGSIFPFLNFSGTMVNSLGSPHFILPPGGVGNLVQSGNTMFINISQPPIPGVNQMGNLSFEQFTTGWTTTAGASVVTTNGSNTYPNTSTCTDTRLIQGLTGGGTNIAKLTGSFVSGGSTNSFSQSVPVNPGNTYSAGAFTYIPNEDAMSGADSFYYEIDFYHTNGTLLAAYESTIVTNLNCSTPSAGIIPMNTWVLMTCTNIMQVTGGNNTGTVIGTVPLAITAPPQSATAKFKAIFVQRNNTDTGSAYFDAANIGLLAGPVPPTIVGAAPNLITLCTNTAFTCIATSSVVQISQISLVVQTTTLGGLTTNTVTNVVGSAGLTVTGLGTSSATVSYTLATNTIYNFVIVNATDTNGVTVSSTNIFDTLVPALVIEASDFNYSSGSFIDTSANGGLGLYAGLVGTPGIDENKAVRTGNIASYYRTNDAVNVGTANPQSPSGTEQKFITGAANGNTNTEQVISYTTAGDWQNYSRTFGAGGSAPTNTYNVWCYLATSGSGVEASFNQVTSDPTQGSQTTNFLGYFGTAAFSDNSYNNFVYVPLVDQFGNRVVLTITNGVKTFKSVVLGNANTAFYMFTPVAPIPYPVLLNTSPNGLTPFGNTGTFSFTIGPAQGASINTNGIGLVVNGVTITSGLTFTAGAGGIWTVTYTVQSNALYSVTITATNTSSLSMAPYTFSFDTFSQNDYQWEAVDYDYSTNNSTSSGGSIGDGWTGGLFIDNSVPTGDVGATPQAGSLATNSYFGYPAFIFPGNDPSGIGAFAHNSVDMNYTNLQAGINAYYRADNVGSQPAQDYVRTKFLVAQTNFADTSIGPVLLGFFNLGNWMNYTRTWPTNGYNIYGRLAGGNGAFSGTTLSLVTSGVGTSNQTTTVLGSFADGSPAGWTTWHWIPLKDGSGNNAIVNLGGVKTLRLTSGNNINAEFFMLVPAPISAFNITAAVVSGQLVISTPTQLGHTYTLWTASPSLLGSWAQVGSAIAGSGSVTNFPAQSISSQGYYKVVGN